jgi:biofilm PGA synthesis N-glycosyltransferase PgaC
MEALHSQILGLLQQLDKTALYERALVFYGLYPLCMSLIWVGLAVFFRCRQESTPLPELEPSLPRVTIIIPAYGEEDVIGRTLAALLEIDYPHYEVLVVNDGSPDHTADIVRSYLHRGPIRLLDKRLNEGKAMALNDALPLCRSEILLILDADIVVEPDILKKFVPHFQSPRVGAVTGNPRVANRTTFLQHLQAIEFSSIISVQRRAQRVWGRVLTVSGAVFAIRRSALMSLGGFTPHMATEDIDLTWRLQMRLWDVRYEPRAIVWMQAPPTLRELWKQRRRWARGLTQVLRRHAIVPFRWTMRRLWPVYYESILSILWAYVFVFVSMYWLVSHLFGYAPVGTSPFPNFWGMLIATACLLQLLTGATVDSRYDKHIFSSYVEAVYYPLVYWMLMGLITAIYTIDALLHRPPPVQTWNIQRRKV